MEARGITLDSADQKTLHAFRQHLPSCRCPRSKGGRTNHHTFYGAELFVTYLRKIGALKGEDGEETKETEPALVQSFRDWLQKHLGLAAFPCGSIAEVLPTC